MDLSSESIVNTFPIETKSSAECVILFSSDFFCWHHYQKSPKNPFRKNWQFSISIGLANFQVCLFNSDLNFLWIIFKGLMWIFDFSITIEFMQCHSDILESQDNCPNDSKIFTSEFSATEKLELFGRCSYAGAKMAIVQSKKSRWIAPETLDHLCASSLNRVVSRENFLEPNKIVFTVNSENCQTWLRTEMNV